MKVGFIGLGNMGLPMARNLLRAGNTLIVYNRTASKAEPLVKEGARIARKPAEAASVEVVVTMLADDQALEQVCFLPDGILDALPRSAIHVSSSTISVDIAERLDREHHNRGQVLVSAPVFGRPEAAEAAKLFVVAAGPTHALEHCRPLFEAMGQKTFTVGERASQANVVKLSGNFMIASAIEVMAEAMSLAEKNGIDGLKWLEVMTGTLFDAPVYRNYGKFVAKRGDVPVGFRLALGLKDVRLALAAAEKAGVPMPVASVIRDHLIQGIAAGWADADWSALSRVVAENAGLKR